MESSGVPQPKTLMQMANMAFVPMSHFLQWVAMVMDSPASFPLNFKASPMTSVQQKAGQMDTDGVEPLKTMIEIRNTDSAQKLPCQQLVEIQKELLVYSPSSSLGINTTPVQVQVAMMASCGVLLPAAMMMTASGAFVQIKDTVSSWLLPTNLAMRWD